MRPNLLPAIAIVSVVVLRALHPDQPIVENYIGRQIPTAMVARNLERGSGFLRPRLSTEPSPNFFLVEPPIYAWLVAITRPLAPDRMEARGRVLSAIATGLGAWGLFGLARRREGQSVAIVAVIAFSAFPVMIRYGRAFQPDALMIGLLMAGMRCLDDAQEGAKSWRLAGAWFCLAAGFAVKVISAYLLVPIVVCLIRPPRRWVIVLLLTTLLPAMAWYVHAGSLLETGSRASSDNAEVWARSLGLSALLRPDTWTTSLWYVVGKSFTPIGFGLAVWGFLARPRPDRFWGIWILSLIAAFAVLSGKIHHEYYWMALAPVMAVGVARGVVAVPNRVAGTMLFLAFATMVLYQSRSTWRTPEEWASLPIASRELRQVVGRDSSPRVVAPESLLFAADLRGFRLEVSPSARERAAGEFSGQIDPGDPLSLIEFYRSRGARFVADVGPLEGDEPRRLLHEAIRRRYNVRMDRDGVLIAELIAHEPRDDE